MKLALIEDNTSIQNIITKLLDENCPEIEVTGIAASIDEGVNLLTTSFPDILLLDVEIIGGSGFDVLKRISNIDFQVIFITAHEKYAIEAIKMSALDFLLKPIDKDELLEALDKAKDKLRNKEATTEIKALIKNLETDQPENLLIKDKYGIHVINVRDIIRMEGDGSYTKVYTIEDDPITSSKPLKEYMDIIGERGFARCHQSHLVNLRFVKRFDRRDGGILILKNRSEIPVATRKKDTLLALMEQFSIK